MALQKVADEKERFLYAWIVIGLVELVAVMPWTAARYIVIVLPPLVWCFMRSLERERSRLFIPVFALSILLGSALAVSDKRQAEAIESLRAWLEPKQVALSAMSPKPAHRWFYFSDTFAGSEPYLSPLGFENALPEDEFHSGIVTGKQIGRAHV